LANESTRNLEEEIFETSKLALNFIGLAASNYWLELDPTG
jgi:hypothetical protein